jgi:hypothetical protein
MENAVIAELFLRFYEREVKPKKKEKCLGGNTVVSQAYLSKRHTMKRNSNSYQKAFEKLVDESLKTLNKSSL